MNAKKKYDKEFRDKILKKIIESDRPTSEIAEEIGIDPGLLRQWKRRYIGLNEKSSKSEISADDFDRLREELDTLKIEKEILLKTLEKLLNL
jgi:transposase